MIKGGRAAGRRARFSVVRNWRPATSLRHSPTKYNHSIRAKPHLDRVSFRTEISPGSTGGILVGRRMLQSQMGRLITLVRIPEADQSSLFDVTWDSHLSAILSPTDSRDVTFPQSLCRLTTPISTLMSSSLPPSAARPSSTARDMYGLPA